MESLEKEKKLFQVDCEVVKTCSVFILAEDKEQAKEIADEKVGSDYYDFDGDYTYYPTEVQNLSDMSVIDLQEEIINTEDFITCEDYFNQLKEDEEKQKMSAKEKEEWNNHSKLDL